jgi:NodT family efflux transporter outer membrane factor (OMF) lipoprotein
MTRCRPAQWLSLAAYVGLLTACAAGPDFRRPELTPTQRYTAEPPRSEASVDGEEASAQRVVFGVALSHEWWRLFQSDALDGVVQRALARNRSLAAAASSLAQAQELARAQAGRLTPQIDLAAGSGRKKYGAEFLGSLPSAPPFTYFSVGAAVSYTLDYTGGVARSVEQRRALAEYQQHQQEAARLAVTGNVVMQALRIASLRAQLASMEGLLDRDREDLKLVETAFDAGSVTRLDVISARSQLAGDMTVLPPLRQELSVARHALAVIVGDLPADSLLPDFDLAQLVLPKDLPVSVPSELARRRPDILAAEAQLHAATAAVGVATGNLYPHINLSASAGQQSVTAEQLFDRGSAVWSLAAGLAAPLFDGGTLRAEKRAAVDAMRASAANYEQTVLEAFGQVANSLDALGHSSEELQAQARAEAAARDTVDMTVQSYKEGNVTVLQVLDAERRFQQARLGYVRALAQRYMDTAQLFLAIGPGA